jgi:hypothetical protein
VIVGSILLILIAAGLLVTGLVLGEDMFLYSSIVASVLAALSLMVGVRQLPATRVPEDDFDVGRPPPELSDEGEPVAVGAVAVGRAGVPAAPSRAGVFSGREGDGEAAVDTSGEPPDEPAPEQISSAAAAKVARLAAPVVVIDGRPRYHLAACLHLLGREGEQLPVAEAAELGFTPCAQCSAASVLLAGHSPS